MLRPAWTARISVLLQRPLALAGIVLVLGATLWWIGGRRPQLVEHRPVAHVAIDEASKAPEIDPQSPMLTEARRLPARISSVPMTARERPVRANFETATPQAERAVQGAGFSANVTSNTPAWLTGTIEVE
ncbi:MAG: hypothetical protein JNG89_04160 [Planctomycetaceae bacterium]|nr:hypothetical protein [Planctomycetaceae bacterium]